MPNILLVSQSDGFIVRSEGACLTEMGYQVIYAGASVEKIKEVKEELDAILLCFDTMKEEDRAALVYLRDKAVEEDVPVFFMGEEDHELLKVFPSHILQEIFRRPIDVKKVAATVQKYISEHGRQNKKKILVVDDSGAMLRTVKGWLGDKYQVILANSGAMAMKYLATNRPDLVLLDYEMPIVDGRQVLGMIRSEVEFASIPVIFLTSKGDRESVMEVMKLKPEGYLLKSLKPDEVIKNIDDFFARQKKI